MVINTTSGPIERNPAPNRHINTSRVVEEDLVYEDEDPEIIAVLAAAGWAAVIEGEDGLRRSVPLVGWVASDSGRMYGVAVGNDGRVDCVENDVEKVPGFRGYEQANTNGKEK